MEEDGGMEFKFGQIVHAMKDSGEEIKQMDKASSGIRMEMFIMEDGKMIKQMVLEPIHTLMEPSMKAFGKKISNMAMVNYFFTLIEIKCILLTISR